MHVLKSAKGGPREIFQKLPKKWPSFEMPKCSLAHMVLSSNWYALNVHTNLNPHFLKSAKGGPREIFRKSPKR